MALSKTKPTLRLLHLDDSQMDLDRVQVALNRNSDWCHYEVESFQTLESYEKRLKGHREPQVALLDLHIQDGVEGLQIARKTRDTFPGIVILFFSSSKDSQSILHAFRNGADDFLSKRSDRDELALRIFKAYELATLKRGGFASQPGKPVFVGKTMQAVANRIPLLLKSAVSSIYVEGESGVGKEVVANLLASELPQGTPFIRINCAALSPSLLESELFGHLRGSFTGANTDKKGLLEAASGGWVFLDEIGCLSPHAQAALLRTLENQEIRRVGDTQIRSIQIRVISANNQPIRDLVKQGSFRRDLWQRMAEVEILLPPLRERHQEIAPLALHFSRVLEGGPYELSEPALEVLHQYDWKEGNIRELRNCIKAMTEFQMKGVLSPLGIPDRVWRYLNMNEDPPSPLPGLSLNHCNYDRLCLEVLSNLMKSLTDSGGKVSQRNLADKLGISRKRLTGLLNDLLQQKFFKPEELDRLVGFKL